MREIQVNQKYSIKSSNDKKSVLGYQIFGLLSLEANKHIFPKEKDPCGHYFKLKIQDL
jgi:hypothetical protein